MPPPGGRSNHSVTPAPCHHDTSSNCSPEDFYSRKKELEVLYEKSKINKLYPWLGEMISGNELDRQEQEEKWEHTSPLQSSSGNRPD
jgi:hypothetical protein